MKHSLNSDRNFVRVCMRLYLFMFTSQFEWKRGWSWIAVIVTRQFFP